MRLKGSDGARRRARVARRAMSAAEVALWRELRKSPAGFHFRRQHPAGVYDLDFYCAPAALAIEVDGEFHDRGDQPERDAIRDAWVAEQGVLTLRFTAQDVFRRLEAVLNHIVSVAMSRQPPSTI
ncbi:endonuclease domain-containing protein [uncultured Sphingomonas sp.]|uniref:endonuclease domain-containing protein n=1 Tax=uncultured Sphingomonas sp. TaxID=158754 RepID=UPI0035CB52E4